MIDWNTVGQLLILVVQSAVLAFQAWLLYGTLNATKMAALAAKKSAEVAEKSVNNIERPYVLLESLTPKIENYMDGTAQTPPAQPHAVLTFKNYGRSPAIVTEVRLAFEMMQQA